MGMEVASLRPRKLEVRISRMVRRGFFDFFDFLSDVDAEVGQQEQHENKGG